jgi:hypothetical protein
VASNQTRAPIFWCVVADGSPAPTWRQIKERRATGGLVYGDGWVTGATLALSTNALSPSTVYDVYAVQETGYSVQSNILAGTVTTAAPAISRIGVGALASSNSVTPLVLTLPTGLSNGDYLVAITSHIDTNAEPSLPLTGWTFIGNGSAATGGQPAIAVWGRARDGSEGTTLSVGYAAAGPKIGFIAAYRGTSGDGAEASGNVFAATSRATPSLTATAESCIIHIWTHEIQSGVVTLPNPSDLIASGNTPDNTYYLGAENQLSTSAGATATRTATGTVSGSWNTMQIELLKA